MNKIIPISFLLTAGLAVSVTSCDLTRLPKDAIDSEESLKTFSDVKNWNNGLKASFRDMQGGLHQMVQDIQGDQLQATFNDGNNYSGSTAWEGVTTGDYNRRDVYIEYYQHILNINKVLEEAPNIKPEKKEDAAALDQMIGGIHFMRAYDYANLALRYGYRYNKSSASSDLCVPLKLTFDPLAKPARATNEAVYNQIYKDLKEAETKLSGKKGAIGADEITLDAVYALEARTHLYTQDWAEALEAAEKLINSGTYQLVTPEKENFVNMWLYDSSSEEILQLYTEQPDEKITINYYYSANLKKVRDEKNNKGVNDPSFLPTQDLLDLYEEGDLRKEVYFEKQVVNIKDNLYNLYVVSKRKGNPQFATNINPALTWWGGYVPNGVHKPKVFRLAEMYLIASEAAFNLKDEAKAKKYLNNLRVSRGLKAVTTSGAALLKEIQDERTRELAFEGFRLWDLRRWGLDVDRDHPQTDENGSSGFLKPGLKEKHYKNSDYRFVWPIPANDINTNENTEQNPGW